MKTSDKKTSIILTALIWLQSLSSLAWAQNTNTYSFASILQNSEINNEMRDQLGPVCSAFLQNVYAAGKTLKSSTILKAAKPLRDAPMFAPNPSFSFYHYTFKQEVVELMHPEITDRAKAHKATLEAGGYNEILRYLRTRQKPFYDMSLYVAIDTDSASRHGNHLIKFIFSPDTIVLDQGKLDLKALADEMEKKFPGLQAACNLGSTFYFIADDSGIDLSDFDSGIGLHRWFQIINFRSLLRTEVLL